MLNSLPLTGNEIKYERRLLRKKCKNFTPFVVIFYGTMNLGPFLRI